MRTNGLGRAFDAIRGDHSIGGAGVAPDRPRSGVAILVVRKDPLEMPWVEAILRGQRVLARSKPDGTLAVEGGRVEIRYGATSARPYHAGARNLELVAGAAPISDEAGPPAAAVSAPGRSQSGAAKPARATPALGTEAGATRAWIAYTDGACSGNPGPAGCGVVLVSPDGKVHEGFDFIGEATNNVAELTAILRAVEWAPADPSAIVVHTDSQYSIGVVQKGWKAKANQELVAKVRATLATRDVRLVYVPGHSGVPLNERADELARESIVSRRTRVAQASG
jgi:ribonuclease HI